MIKNLQIFYTILIWGLLSPYIGFTQSAPRVKLGGWIGLGSQFLNVQNLPNTDQFFVASGKGGIIPGITTGGFARFSFYKSWAFQPGLSLSLHHNYLIFPPTKQVVSYRFTDIEIPLHVLWVNPDNLLPLRGSIIFGLRAGWSFSDQPTEQLALLRERMDLDLGIGAKFKTRWYHLHPEILYSYGLNNLHRYSNTTIDPFVGRIQRDRVTLRVSVTRE